MAVVPESSRSSAKHLFSIILLIAGSLVALAAVTERGSQVLRLGRALVPGPPADGSPANDYLINTRDPITADDLAAAQHQVEVAEAAAAEALPGAGQALAAARARLALLHQLHECQN